MVIIKMPERIKPRFNRYIGIDYSGAVNQRGQTPFPRPLFQNSQSGNPLDFCFPTLYFSM